MYSQLISVIEAFFFFLQHRRESKRREEKEEENQVLNEVPFTFTMAIAMPFTRSPFDWILLIVLLIESIRVSRIRDAVQYKISICDAI